MEKREKFVSLKKNLTLIWEIVDISAVFSAKILEKKTYARLMIVLEYDEIYCR